MYIPNDNKVENQAELLDFMSRNSFATLVGVAENRPFATHLPFVVEEREGLVFLRSHLAKANPHGKLLLNGDALVMFQSPHAYISPKHYTSRQNVPTWNYIAVHCYGAVRILEDAEPVLQATMRQYEAEYEAQWDSLPELYKKRMKEGIIAFEIAVHTLEGKYKLSQNKTPDEKERITNALLQSDRTEIRETGEYMRRLVLNKNDDTEFP